MRHKLIYGLGIIGIFVFAILNTVMFIKGVEYGNDVGIQNNSTNVTVGKQDTGLKCPDATGGLNKAFLHVKYFYSEYCPWCQKQEPILQKLVKKYTNFVYIEWYNVNDCQSMVEEYKVSGVPTTVFKTFDNHTEYSHYGFVYEKDFVKLICDVAGGCA